ncbi:hypothetical protein TNCV_1798121 [Trichonephila clavipes]|nr:hypothetical protein TNCV_1798121 [Trichonephila clavipes]
MKTSSVNFHTPSPMESKHGRPCLFRLLYVSDSPLVSMKKEKRDVPLRTAYSQAGRLWQPKPKRYLRAQAQLMRTETCGLLKTLEKGERERQRCASSTLPSAYHRQTYLLE